MPFDTSFNEKIKNLITRYTEENKALQLEDKTEKILTKTDFFLKESKKILKKGFDLCDDAINIVKGNIKNTEKKEIIEKTHEYIKNLCNKYIDEKIVIPKENPQNWHALLAWLGEKADGDTKQPAFYGRFHMLLHAIRTVILKEIKNLDVDIPQNKTIIDDLNETCQSINASYADTEKLHEKIKCATTKNIKLSQSVLLTWLGDTKLLISESYYKEFYPEKSLLGKGHRYKDGYPIIFNQDFDDLYLTEILPTASIKKDKLKIIEEKKEDEEYLEIQHIDARDIDRPLSQSSSTIFSKTSAQDDEEKKDQKKEITINTLSRI